MILTWAVTILLFGGAFCNDSTYPRHGRAPRTKMFGVENLVYNSRKSSPILGTNKIAILKNILQNRLITFLRLKKSCFNSKPDSLCNVYFNRGDRADCRPEPSRGGHQPPAAGRCLDVRRQELAGSVMTSISKQSAQQPLMR